MTRIDREITAHFRLSEVWCKCGCETPPTVVVNLMETCRLVEAAFRILGPIKVESGYRCAAHNAETAGSASRSQHLVGKAMDLQIDGYTGEQLRRHAEKSIGFGELAEGGLGTYASKPKTLHYDWRGYHARWRMP